MAAAITTTATTAEAQLFEVAGAIQDLEAAALAANPDFEQLLTIATDAEAGTVTVTATIPAAFTSTGGVLSFTPTEYL